jgi:hypothetical protein
MRNWPLAKAITMPGDMIIDLAIASTKPKQLHPTQGEDVRFCRKFCNWLNPVEKTELAYPANE